MRILSESSLIAYAHVFWLRQAEKNDPNDHEALAEINDGGNIVERLRLSYRYKLPYPSNNAVNIVQIESREELDRLLVHDYMPCDAWMRDRNVVPEPYTRSLGQLALTFLDREYFATPRNDRQYVLFCQWREIGSLEHAIDPNDRPLIQSVEHLGNREYEIVDGWGRLLPFASLVQEGLTFHPFEAFLAFRNP